MGDGKSRQGHNKKLYRELSAMGFHNVLFPPDIFGDISGSSDDSEEGKRHCHCVELKYTRWLHLKRQGRREIARGAARDISSNKLFNSKTII